MHWWLVYSCNKSGYLGSLTQLNSWFESIFRLVRIYKYKFNVKLGTHSNFTLLCSLSATDNCLTTSLILERSRNTEIQRRVLRDLVCRGRCCVTWSAEAGVARHGLLMQVLRDLVCRDGWCKTWSAETGVARPALKRQMLRDLVCRGS